MGTTEHMWSGRLLFAVIASRFLTKATQAQTIINVASGSDLVNALTTVDNNPSTNYRINFTQSVTLDSTTTLPAINTSANLTITGNNKTLDGGGVQRGFFVYAGSVGISDLTIANAQALGGTGGHGGATGGGGLGAGGAIFVASSGTLTASNLHLVTNTSMGGNGGPCCGGGGGGGGWHGR